jgi:tetratricopeptide (TPR) repeat protein
LEERISDLRLARNRSNEAGRPEQAAELALTLCRLLQRRGFSIAAVAPIEEGLTALRPLLPQHSLTYAHLLRERAGLHLDKGEPTEARQKAEEALALFHAAGDATEEAQTLNVLGQAAMVGKQFAEARSLLTEALHRADALHDETLSAIVHNNLGLVARRDPAGDRDTARFHLNESLQRKIAQKNWRGAASTFINLGVQSHTEGDLDTAERLYMDALTYEQQVGHRYGIGRALNNLGEIAEAREQWKQAGRLYAAAERLFAEVQSPNREYTAGLLEKAPLLPEYLARLRQEAAIRDSDALIAWAFFSP